MKNQNKTSMAKAMGPSEITGPSWLSGLRTDVPAEPPSHRPYGNHQVMIYLFINHKILSYVFLSFRCYIFSPQSNTAIIGLKTKPIRKSSDNDIL